MPTLATRFNWGGEIRNINQVLYNQLNDSYSDITRVVNIKVTRNITNVDPPADAQINANFDVGDIWVNQSSNTGWLMTSRTTTTAVTWTQIT